jgi:hypothetical protein
MELLLENLRHGRIQGGNNSHEHGNCKQKVVNFATRDFLIGRFSSSALSQHWVCFNRIVFLVVF